VGRLVYSAIASLDGYVNDAEGRFDWSTPDAEVHAFVNDLERPIGTYLYGRRMYEVMRFWQTGGDEPGSPAETGDYARIWRNADKIVFSSSLDRVETPRTQLERSFDPEAIRRLKQDSGRDLSVGGPGLAGAALGDGLVDEIHLFLSPVVVGAGTRALPDAVRLALDLVSERRFANGVVHLHYAVGR
jgi:dihydrofolate reductase